MLKTNSLPLRRFQLMALEHIERRATRMRDRRIELELTQEAVADRMQMIHAERHPDDPPDQTRGQMVSDWERAVNEPSPKKIELLAAALDWTVGDLNSDAPAITKETPDVMSELSGDAPDLRAQLNRIEETLGVMKTDLARLATDVAARTTPARKRQRPKPASGSQG